MGLIIFSVVVYGLFYYGLAQPFFELLGKFCRILAKLGAKRRWTALGEFCFLLTKIKAKKRLTFSVVRVS